MEVVCYGFHHAVHPSPRNQNWLKQNPGFSTGNCADARQARGRCASVVLTSGCFPSERPDLPPPAHRPSFLRADFHYCSGIKVLHETDRRINNLSAILGDTRLYQPPSHRMSFRDRCCAAAALRYDSSETPGVSTRSLPESPLTGANFLRFDTAWIGGATLEPVSWRVATCKDCGHPARVIQRYPSDQQAELGAPRCPLLFHPGINTHVPREASPNGPPRSRAERNCDSEACGRGGHASTAENNLGDHELPVVPPIAPGHG